MLRNPANPVVDERFSAAFYHRYYGARQTRVASFEDYRLRANLIAAYAATLRAPIRRILDVGAGTGLFRKALQAHFKRAQFVGIEVSAYACNRYGWQNASIVHYTGAGEFDLVLCHDVLQYLKLADAVRAIRNLNTLCAGLLYYTVLTREDWNDNCDQERTDGDVNLRAAAWYRRRLARNFRRLGMGVYVTCRAECRVAALDQDAEFSTRRPAK